MQSSIIKEHTGEFHELRALFEKQLRELYWAENTMLKLLSGIIIQAYSHDLIKVLENHRTKTISHINRLERIFVITGVTTEETPYEAMECQIKELENLIHTTKHGVVRDAGVIALLQKMEHHEIACYGTMRAYAIALREEEAVSLLSDTLEEEKEADRELSKIAESHINTEAADKEI